MLEAVCMTEENLKKGQQLTEENKQLARALLCIGSVLHNQPPPPGIPQDLWEIGCNQMVDAANNRITENTKLFESL